MQISIFFSYEMPTFWSSEINEAILEKSESGRIGLWLHASIF